MNTEAIFGESFFRWLVLLVRLAMPWAPESCISLYNLLPPSLAGRSSSPGATITNWGTYRRPQGVWLVSHYVDMGYLRRAEDGRVRAEVWSRDSASYWDVHAVWRVKTSDDPSASPQWPQEKIPGPD